MLDTSICRELLRIYIYVIHNLVLIFSISLDLLHLFTSQTLSTFSKSSTHVIFGFSLLKITWYDLFLLILHAFHVLKLKFWGFEKFWDFSKLMSYCWNFWVGLCLCDLKTSCIAFHVHYNCISMHLVVCYTCWTACVLVGLDWAEPMMLFLLHVTCSCIPYAYVLLFQYTCYIWTI